MSVKGSVFIATSLDGYIARDDGSIDWLEKANTRVPKGEDFGYKEFFSSVDILVMGRNTYELVRTFGSWPYGKKPVVVLSSRAIKIPKAISKTVSLSSENPLALFDRLSADGVKHVYIDGGITIQRFLTARLIDELTVTLIPVLIGSGKPLFGALLNDILLELVSTKAYECGFVQNKYRVLR
jgi:dihydrofolate reductase